MADKPARLGSLGATRARIIDLIRREPTTISEIARQLELSYNAVRGHLDALQRDGIVRPAGERRGETRPSALYELSPGAHEVLSRAYMPFASQLVRALSERLSDDELDALMRDVGDRLAAEWPRPTGTLAERVEQAAALLQELGAPNEVERVGDGFRIRGFGCSLAAAVHGQPHVCHAMETLLSTLLEARVRECCDRGAQPRCCFVIDGGA
jgi:predicted ArsR family transcriptional regulator